jgi:hypothetical protein
LLTSNGIGVPCWSIYVTFTCVIWW